MEKNAPWKKQPTLIYYNEMFLSRERCCIANIESLLNDLLMIELLHFICFRLFIMGHPTVPTSAHNQHDNPKIVGHYINITGGGGGGGGGG